jgi:hypothetical protein
MLSAEERLAALAGPLDRGDWDDVVARAGRRQTVRRSRRRVVVLVALVAAGVVSFAAVGLFDRGPGPTVVERALAAVGDGPVLHVVVRQTQPLGYELVDLATGERTRPTRTVEREIWYDGDRAMQHTIVRENGRVVDDLLHTPAGVFSSNGIVYTCAWIAKHPVEATKARVSCNANMENGTTPRSIPERPPYIDPALGGFASRYQDALASGAAKVTGEGVLDGRPVYWLTFSSAERVSSASTPRERVAVDKDTYRPIVVHTVIDGRTTSTVEVISIDTVNREAGDFARPVDKQAPPTIVSSSQVGREDVSLAEARALLGGRLVWVGRNIEGLPLAAIEKRVIVSGYGSASGLAPRHGTAVALIYGEMQNGRPHGRYIEIDQAAQPESVFGLTEMFNAPSGYLQLPAPWWGFLRAEGLYVRIFGPGATDLVVPAAQALVEADG